MFTCRNAIFRFPKKTGEVYRVIKISRYKKVDVFSCAFHDAIKKIFIFAPNFVKSNRLLN